MKVAVAMPDAVAVPDATTTSPAGLRPKETERRLRLQRRLARQQKGSNRGIPTAHGREDVKGGHRRWGDGLSTEVSLAWSSGAGR